MVRRDWASSTLFVWMSLKLFRKTITRTCSVCGKEIQIKLRRPRFGFHFWKWKIVAGGYYWWTLEELPTEPEYWECVPCFNLDD